MQHIPVLLQETISGLALFPGCSCIDGTLGGGGHAAAILAASAPDGRLLGIDTDPAAIGNSRRRLAEFGARAVLAQGNFRDISAIAGVHGFSQVEGILLDLGVSSVQLGEAERGFSFQADGPLDMRLDPGGELTAGEIVNEWSADEMADVFYQYGEEPRSRRIARAIVSARPLQTTLELAEVVRRAAGVRGHQRIHPATRVFQSLRIRVNDELGALSSALQQSLELLAPGGRIAVITFHSLEDRIVKQFVQREARDCICPPELPACVCGHHSTMKAITRHPVQPAVEEIGRNNRARSAKLRVAIRL